MRFVASMALHWLRAVAAFQGKTQVVSLLLERGADIHDVGGSYLTTSGVYPSALDVARSKDSKAFSELLAILETANPNVDSVNNVISRPPFPCHIPGRILRHIPTTIRIHPH